ncbi:MAG: hypothetical protein Q9217_002030 [Psora testacea]
MAKAKSKQDWMNSGNDPLTRWGLWDQTQVVDAIVVQCQIADYAAHLPNRFMGNFDELAVELAQTVNDLLGQNMAPNNIMEIYRWMRDNCNHPRNPYPKWERGCRAFVSGMQGNAYDIQVRDGEYSLADVKEFLAQLMLRRLEVSLGQDVAEEAEECVRQSIRETASGIDSENNHRPHRGACKLTRGRGGGAHSVHSDYSGTTLVGGSSDDSEDGGHGEYGGYGGHRADRYSADGDPYPGRYNRSFSDGFPQGTYGNGGGYRSSGYHGSRRRERY